MLYDVTTPEGLASIDAVRERFLEDPETDLSGIRPAIADSWRRSAAMRIDPAAPVQIDEVARVDEQTLRCAAPFVKELERMAADVGGYVTISSPGGALVKEFALGAEDRYPQGLVLLESTCGTNSDGTALEDGHSGWVYSREHYREDFASTSCFSALVRDPFRDNVRACLTLTLPEAVMLSSDPGAVGLLVEGTAAKIARDLAARSAPREQMLFAEYLKATRRQRNGAILATDGKNTMVSDPALELLREDDFAAISSYAQETLRSGRPVKHDVMLSGGRLVGLSISLVGDGADPLGVLVLVKQAASAIARSTGQAGAGPPTRAAVSDVFDGLVGDSPGFRQELEVATGAIADRRPAHVMGESGTGKRMLATRIAGAWSDRVEALDCARPESDGPALVEEVRGHVDAGAAVVLGNADLLAAPTAAALAELSRQVERPGVVLTLRRPTTSAVALISSLNSVEIALPSLRERREDVPALATRFIADLTHKKPAARLLYVLAQADWPGNVAQLKSAVEQAAMAAQGPQIGVADLPQGLLGGMSQGPLSRLEELELHELRAALEEAKGNRTLAAEILQIGRSTLYRRLDSYRRRGIFI